MASQNRRHSSVCPLLSRPDRTFAATLPFCPACRGTFCPQIQAIPQGFGSEAPLIEEEAADITDEAAYSIQEDKLKTEDDNR